MAAAGGHSPLLQFTSTRVSQLPHDAVSNAVADDAFRTALNSPWNRAERNPDVQASAFSVEQQLRLLLRRSLV